MSKSKASSISMAAFSDLFAACSIADLARRRNHGSTSSAYIPVDRLRSSRQQSINIAVRPVAIPH
jgi:hypothetical protein